MVSVDSKEQLAVGIAQFFGDFVLYVLLTFILTFVLFGVIYRNGYLKTEPTDNPNEEDVEEEYEEWWREQQFSSILAGFSLTALVFVLAFEELVKLQQMVEFFLIGFILEVLSFISYKYMITRAYEYYGTLFQFAGLLAIINGFFIFISDKLLLSPVIIMTFIGGYALFFFLSLKQLKVYLDSFIAYDEQHQA